MNYRCERRRNVNLQFAGMLKSLYFLPTCSFQNGYYYFCWWNRAEGTSAQGKDLLLCQKDATVLKDEDASRAFCLESVELNLGCPTLGVSSHPVSGVSKLTEFFGIGSKNTAKSLLLKRVQNQSRGFEWLENTSPAQHVMSIWTPFLMFWKYHCTYRVKQFSLVIMSSLWASIME